MPTLFRAMKESTAGKPQLGGSARTLGVRLGIDVPAYPMTADEYRQALEATHPLWRKAVPP
jgi:hypothetical protein